MKTFLLLALVSVSLVRLPAQTNPPAGATLDFNNAELNQVLNIYAEVSGRTLLRHPALAARPFALHVSATNRAELAALLEKLLADQNISVIPDGEKFAIVVQKPLASQVHARAPKATSGASISAGEVNFMGADLRLVAAIYADLLDKKLDGTNWQEIGFAPVFQFRNQTPLAKNELIYALETQFEWSGIRFVPAGDGFIKPERIVPSPKPMP